MDLSNELTNNYARHLRTGRVFFFSTTAIPPELPTGDQCDWVLWQRPLGAAWRNFRQVGETPEEYCALNLHRPGACKACKLQRARMGRVAAN